MNPYLQKIVNDFGKRRDNREVLEEDEYLDKLEKVIIRDYYPHLEQIDEESEEEGEESTDKRLLPKKKLSITEFIRKYVSEDDKSFGDIMEKERLGFIAKHYDMFHFLHEKNVIQNKQLGYSMTKKAIQENSDQLYNTKSKSKQAILALSVFCPAN